MIWEDETAAGHIFHRLQAMDMTVTGVDPGTVVYIELPGKGAGRERPILGVGAGTGEGHGLAHGESEPVAGDVMVAVGGVLPTSMVTLPPDHFALSYCLTRRG